jgi:hypothetical protein
MRSPRGHAQVIPRRHLHDHSGAGEVLEDVMTIATTDMMRTARKGSNVGNAFCGCSQFP